MASRVALAIVLALASLSTSAAGSAEGAGSGPTCVVASGALPGDDSRAIDELVSVADGVRSGSVRMNSDGVASQPEPALDVWARITRLTDRAEAIASSPMAREAWRAADPVGALAEAAIPMGREARVALIDVLLRVAAVAPTIDDGVRALELAATIGEPLSHPASVRVLGPEARPASGAVVIGGGASLQPVTTMTPVGVGLDVGPEAVRARVRIALGTIESMTGVRPDALLARLRSRSGALAIGAMAPRYAGHDAAGNEVHSESLRGQIVVLRFWDHGSAASVAAHERDMVLLRRHWNSPVEFVGVCADPDRDRHLERLQQLRLGGTQIYEGPVGINLVRALAARSDVTPSVFEGSAGAADAETAQAAAPRSATEAMLEPPHGALFVLDARGRVRGRDLSHRELDRLLTRLVAEHRASFRHRRSAIQPGSRGAEDPPASVRTRAR